MGDMLGGLDGQRKADNGVRLWGACGMPLECWVSNSGTSFVKSRSDGVAAKATEWIKGFGQTQLVPAAMPAEVFKTGHMVEAQANALAIWWSHDLGVPTCWIEWTRACVDAIRA